MSGRLAGKVALVTGAAQGIGEAICRRFVAEGARVVGIDHHGTKLATLAQAMPALMPWEADVTDHAALARCVTSITTDGTPIDILVNNAGFQYTLPFLETTQEHWQRTHAVNLEAQFALCKLVTPSMIRAGYGRIVNISSTQSIAVEANVAAYAASKGGVGALTRSLAVELAPHGVLVNAIAPGPIHTPMAVVDGVDQFETEAFQEWYVRHRRIPLGRPGEADEIAAVALFLASQECSFVTGHTLVADGGMTITF